MIEFRRLAIVSIMLVGVGACSRTAAPVAGGPPELGVVVVQPTSVALTRELVGRLSATRSAEVRARVPGILLSRRYQEGSDVVAGQVLFEIDPAPLMASLRSREAALAQARAQSVNAENRRTRMRDLAGKGVVAKQDADDAEAAALSAAAGVLEAEADVQNAGLSLSQATVRAPIAGRAGKALVTEGALVGEGTATPLTIVEQLDPLYVEFSESAAEVDALMRAAAEGGLSLSTQNEATVRIRTPDGQWYGHQGDLGFADLAVDPRTGAIALRATLPNPDRRLLPGMFVTVELTHGQRRDAFLVSQLALQRDARGPYALVVEQDQKVARRDLQLDGQKDSNWVVVAGLTAGDRVVVSGLQKARIGMPAKATVMAAPAQGGQDADARPIAARPQG